MIKVLKKLTDNVDAKIFALRQNASAWSTSISKQFFMLKQRIIPKKSE